MDASWLEPLARDVLPDLIELHPTNLGEPFSWPHFRRLCRLLHEHGVVLDLTTNGTQLDARRIEWIAPIARDVKISFDGATAPTFERFRRGADFQRVCENVQALTQRLQRVTTRRPVVALLHPRLPAWVGRLSRSGRAPCVITNGVRLTPGLQDALIGAGIAQIQVSVHSLDPDIARQVVPRGPRPGAAGTGCGIFAAVTFITSDGDVLPCVNDVRGAHALGNARELCWDEVVAWKRRVIGHGQWFDACHDCDDDYRWVLIGQGALDEPPPSR